MMKFRLSLAIAVCFGTSWVWANSLYSRLGVGLVHLRDGVRAIGMGNASLAAADGLSVYHLNPATLAGVAFTRLQTEFGYESADVKVKTTTGLEGPSTGRFRDANFNGVSLLLPVKRGYSVAFGLAPYSRMAFTLNQLAGGYEEIYSGSGGLDEAYLAFAGTVGGPATGLRYGIAADFYFGRIQRSWRVNFSSGLLQPTEDRVGAYLHGIGYHAGLHWFHRHWQLGLAVRPPVDLNVETAVEYIFAGGSDLIKTKTTLPLWIGVGVGYQPSSQWQFAADYRFQRWGNVEQSKRLGATLTDSYEFGAGVEWVPSRNPIDSYFKRIAYRAGATFSRLPYQEPAGQEVAEKVVTAGLGFPYRLGASRLDVAVEYGKRGSLGNNPAEETLFRFSIAASGAERWFMRRQQ